MLHQAIRLTEVCKTTVVQVTDKSKTEQDRTFFAETPAVLDTEDILRV
jgi:hypothetical protein